MDFQTGAIADIYARLARCAETLTGLRNQSMLDLYLRQYPNENAIDHAATDVAELECVVNQNARLIRPELKSQLAEIISAASKFSERFQDLRTKNRDFQLKPLDECVDRFIPLAKRSLEENLLSRAAVGWRNGASIPIAFAIRPDAWFNNQKGEQEWNKTSIAEKIRRISGFYCEVLKGAIERGEVTRDDLLEMAASGDLLRLPKKRKSQVGVLQKGLNRICDLGSGLDVPTLWERFAKIIARLYGKTLPSLAPSSRDQSDHNKGNTLNTPSADAHGEFSSLRQKIIVAGQSADLTKHEDWLLGVARDGAQNAAIRRSALVALRKLRSSKARPMLIQLLMTEHENENLRETAIKALGAIGEPPDLEILGGLMKSESIARFGRQAAQNAYATLEARLGGERGSLQEHSKPEIAARRTVFICHASEDKASVVEPLVKYMTSAGISVWYDRAQIKWGDSLTGKVNEGLSVSEYVIVVLTKSFLAKHWPRMELNAALNVEASTGRNVMLPLIAGSDQDRTEILRQLPILNHKLHLRWDGSPEKIVAALQERSSGKNPN